MVQRLIDILGRNPVPRGLIVVAGGETLYSNRAAGEIVARVARVGQRGVVSGPVVVGLASFTAGFLVGTWLNETFCLSDKISDFLIDLTQLDPGTEHAFQQFVENRGGSLGILDLAEFTERCTGGAMTAFCAGFAPR